MIATRGWTCCMKKSFKILPVDRKSRLWRDVKRGVLANHFSPHWSNLIFIPVSITPSKKTCVSSPASAGYKFPENLFCAVSYLSLKLNEQINSSHFIFHSSFGRIRLIVCFTFSLVLVGRLPPPLAPPSIDLPTAIQAKGRAIESDGLVSHHHRHLTLPSTPDSSRGLSRWGGEICSK